MSALIAHCSCPDTEVAMRISRALVDERLAACVQVIPAISSTYRWQGEVQVDAEALLLIKTTVARLDALKARLPSLHPYAVPELLVVESTDGLPAYLDWLESATTDA